MSPTSVDVLIALRDALTAAIESENACAELQHRLRESEAAHAATRLRLAALRETLLAADDAEPAVPPPPPPRPREKILPIRRSVSCEESMCVRCHVAMWAGVRIDNHVYCGRCADSVRRYPMQPEIV